MILNLRLSAKFWQILTVLAVAVVLLISAFLGVSSGKKSAQAKLIVNNAKAVKTGLDFFNGDYNRFPSAVEFSDSNLMGNYFNIFPPQDIVSVVCKESFVYKRISNSSFQLNFCLPKAAQGFKQGWNTLNN